MINLIFVIIAATCQPVDGPCLRQLTEASKPHKDLTKVANSWLEKIDAALVKRAESGSTYLDFPTRGMPKDVEDVVVARLRYRVGLMVMSWSETTPDMAMLSYPRNFIRISWFVEY